MPSSSVTVNNLAEHLAWFLREKPFIPPPLSVPETSIRSAPGTAIGDSFSGKSANLIEYAADLTTQSNSATAAHVDTAGGSAVVEEDPVEAQLSQLSAEEEETGPASIASRDVDMARLRVEPTSTSKPRLLSTTSNHEERTPCMFESIYSAPLFTTDFCSKFYTNFPTSFP
jgi:hypothetical protein